MAMPAKDMTGLRFGALVAMHRVPAPAGKASGWECRCDCGRTKTIDGSQLRRGCAKSCGCERLKRMSAAAKTHGLSRSYIYRCWSAMRARCENPSAVGWKNYGARGVRVVERWLLFQNFLTDMGMPPSHRHQIDRIHSDSDYGPGLYRWALPIEQQNNRRNNIRIEHGGRSLTLAQWSRELGINYATAWERIRRGVAPVVALGLEAP
jgi:hypothetical protein